MVKVERVIASMMLMLLLMSCEACAWWWPFETTQPAVPDRLPYPEVPLPEPKVPDIPTIKLPNPDDGLMTGVINVQTKPLLDGGSETRISVEPSKSGALTGAAAGAALGAKIGTMIGGPAGTAAGAATGAVIGGIIGWFLGPA